MSALEHVPAHWTNSDGARLYGPTDMARALDVTPSAVANYLTRGTGPIPTPTHRRSWRGRDVPLWTAAQVDTARRNAIAELERALSVLEGKRRALDRTAVAYRRRLERLTLDTTRADGNVHSNTAAPQ